MPAIQVRLSSFVVMFFCLQFFSSSFAANTLSVLLNPNLLSAPLCRMCHGAGNLSITSREDPFGAHPLRLHDLSEQQDHTSSSGIAEGSEFWCHVHSTSPSKCRWLDIPALPAAESTTAGIGRSSRTNTLAA